MNILAIIPAYNEQECIENTISMLKEELPQLDYIIINDGSRDLTGEICAKNKFNCINLPVNTGLACAFQTGMKYAWRQGYDAAIQFDADGQHLPAYIPKMAECMKACDADIVIASRFVSGKKPEGARGAGSRLISWLIHKTCGITIQDPTSGMRMFNRRMIEIYAQSFDLTPEPDALALLARRGAKICEIEAKMQQRQGGESYFDLPNIISYMARTCFSLVLFQWLRKDTKCL